MDARKRRTTTLFRPWVPGNETAITSTSLATSVHFTASQNTDTKFLPR